MTTDPSSFPETVHPSLLLLVLDLHPLSWSLLSSLPAAPPDPSTPAFLAKVPVSPLALTEFITNIIVFLNAHLASRWGNKVVVYGASAGKSRLLYPAERETGKSTEGPSGNVYEPFRVLDKRLEEAMRAMVAEEAARAERGETGLNEPPAIVSAMTKALCYINRSMPPAPPGGSLVHNEDSSGNHNPDRLETRIMVVNATPGSSFSDAESKGQGGSMRGGYVGLMNCVFAAQKAKVPIDVLTLPPPSTQTTAPIFLQQASHLTGGVYWRWNGRGGLLQYLHAMYLSPPSLRHTTFATPPQDAVDFRAVCFCHHDVVDVGFVCSVCLSIFCKPLPVCQMCKTKFPLKALPVLKQLAELVEPIPVPETIPPTIVKKERGLEGKEPTKKKRRADDGEGAAVAA